MTAAMLMHPWDDHFAPDPQLEAHIYELKGKGLLALQSATTDPERLSRASFALFTYYEAAKSRGAMHYAQKYLPYAKPWMAKNGKQVE
jgi:hypothetical protein